MEAKGIPQFRENVVLLAILGWMRNMGNIEVYERNEKQKQPLTKIRKKVRSKPYSSIDRNPCNHGNSWFLKEYEEE